jgi:hypothetical protein
MKNTLSLLFVILLCVHLASCDLRFVFSMFRHGARQPTAIKNGVDIFGEHWDAPGELTAAGRRMQFLLGSRNREVYGDFVTKNRIGGSVFVRASDFNRTIESVLSQMQGFFPPGSADLIANEKTRKFAHPFIDSPYGSNWTNVDSWLGMRSLKSRVETVPVHLFSRVNRFNNIFYAPYSCKPVLGMSKGNIQKPVIQDFITKNIAKWGKILQQLAGKEDTEFLKSYWYLFSMFDSFISDMYDGRNLTKAIDAGLDLQAFNKTAFEFAKNDILVQFNGDKESFFARWTMSILWPEVIGWMEARIAADKSGDEEFKGYKLPRFAFFSTHDVTVGSGLVVLNRAFGTPLYYTPFASDIFFELHRNDKGEYKVHIKYQNLTLAVKSFEEFKTKLEAQFYTREQIMETCGWDTEEMHYFLPENQPHH